MKSLLWLRFEHEGDAHFGTLEDGVIRVWQGDMFDAPEPTERYFPLSEVQVQMPCHPPKMIGLWNNFHERMVKEGLHRPTHPLYFLKGSNCYAGPGDAIRRPPGYGGIVVFEGEIGIVIGKRCTRVSVADALESVFGYTCVNDVTARDLLRLDPAFAHWTRAKSFDSFGTFGPVIASGIDPAGLRIQAFLDGQELQNYPVSDMIFSPAEIVSHLSHDMTLEPGDVIACGTSVGAGPMQNGQRIEIVIEGIGRLTNLFG